MVFMPSRYFRLDRDTLAIADREGKSLAVTVPCGACIRMGEVIAGNRFVDVEWAGEIVQMFLLDVYERGELIRAVS
jgi:hypothetical protein